MSSSPTPTADEVAWWGVFIQRHEHLRECAERLEASLDEYKAAIPSHDHDADLADMRRMLDEGGALIARWRDRMLTVEGD